MDEGNSRHQLLISCAPSKGTYRSSLKFSSNCLLSSWADETAMEVMGTLAMENLSSWVPSEDSGYEGAVAGVTRYL